MTAIGFIIEPGQSIPDDVTGWKDKDGDEMRRMPEGWWCCNMDAPHTCAQHADEEVLRYAPLTVTAVREQPAELERACWKCGLGIGEIVDRGVNSFADGRLRFMHAYGECPTADQLVQHAAELGIAEPLNINGLIRDSREIMAILGVSEAADVLPELKRRLAPQPVAEPVPDVLDLVRQYGARVGEAAETVEDNDETILRDEAEALFARIEAEVQRLRDERDEARGQARTMAAAAERFQAAIRAREEEDETRGWSDWNLMQALGVEQLTDVLPAIEGLWAERDAVKADRDRLLAAPDPLVLSLPQVPEGAAIVGFLPASRQRIRLAQRGDGLWYDDEGEFVPRQLGAVLDALESVTVVMREPRTWPKLDAPDASAVRGASGRIWRRVSPTVWACNDDEGGEECENFAALQQYDGPLVEVFDGKDGTR